MNKSDSFYDNQISVKRSLIRNYVLKKKKVITSPGGNQLKPGSRREWKPSKWDLVSSPPSIWQRTDISRATLGMAWGITKSRKEWK